MIYKKYLLLGVSLCMLNACNESKSVSLEGSLDGIQADSIYLYQVDNEHYGSVKLIKSIAVTDGRFAYPTDSIQVGLYCFSLQNMERGLPFIFLFVYLLYGGFIPRQSFLYRL